MLVRNMSPRPITGTAQEDLKMFAMNSTATMSATKVKMLSDGSTALTSVYFSPVNPVTRVSLLVARSKRSYQ
ncbi:unannotated protein [freshwater metagenome]|uniref:Unannotated protein n=1 Tax=freshwater metagenome TaxID=449393 RepID=A0A6J7EHA4_9ZZZZ